MKPKMIHLLAAFAWTITALADPVTTSSPWGTIRFEQRGNPEAICTWRNWELLDKNGNIHTFPGQTEQRGIRHPDGTVTNLHTSSLNVASTDGQFFLRAKGMNADVLLTNTEYPKFHVLSVSYAPPGPNSTVDYLNSTSVGVTNTIEKSFIESTGFNASLNVYSFGIDFTRSSFNAISSSILKTVSHNLMDINHTNVINHDLDRIEILLNPSVNMEYSDLTRGTFSIELNPSDHYLPLYNGMPQPDTITLYAGWLNGNIPWPTSGDYQERLRRAWDSSIPNPGLTTADYAAILAMDPFAQQIDPNTGALLPIKSQSAIYGETMQPGRERYTLIRSINYTQVDQKITTAISNVTTSSETNSASSSLTVSKGSKFNLFGFGVSTRDQWTWTNRVTRQTGTTTSSAATINIYMPDGSVPYPPKTSVDIYQDNLYGTYMFSFPEGGF